MIRVIENLFKKEFLARYMVSLFVLFLGLFYALSFLGNVTDYHSNFLLVQAVLSMKGAPDSAGIAWRSVQSPVLQNIGYLMIVFTEAVISLLALLGSFAMLRASHQDEKSFESAKTLALLAIGLGITLYFFGYLVLGDQWFRAWMSSETENVQALGFQFFTFFSFLFLMLRTTK